MTEIVKLVKTDESSFFIREFLLYAKSDKGLRPKTITAYEIDLEELKNIFSKQKFA
ncbi:MAG TPA: site-specific integrase [Bacillales bacterium]|nr:site-specific integrase [Bacillales bacterium]